MEYEALIKIFQAFATAAIIFWIIFYAPTSINLSYGYFLANLVILIPLLFYFHFKVSKISFNFKKDIFKILKVSWPLSFGFMIGWIYIYVSSVVLGYFNLIAENGWYNAASKIALATIIPATLVIRSFYPTLSNLYVSSKEKLQKAWDYLAEIMLVLTVPTVVGGIVAAPKIISLFYGQGFEPSILALQLLMIVIGFSFLNYPYAIMLIVADRQKENFWIIVAGSVLNVILSIFFIEEFGFYGSIFSIILVSLISFIITVFLAKKFAVVVPFDKKLLKVLVSSVASAFIMYLLVNTNFIKETNLFIMCGTGAIIYFICIFIFYKIFFPTRKIFSLTQWIQ